MLSEAMLCAAEFAYEKLGRKSITTAPEAVFVDDVNEHWKVAINGSKTNKRVGPEGCMATSLAPYQMAVWWHGWLAGLLSPAGGEIAAHPDGANEDRLIADLRAATSAIREAVR